MFIKNNSKHFSLDRVESSWYDRARVRCHHLFDATLFKTDKLDFLPEWLPFGFHPDYDALSDSLKSKILSVGWLLYNQGTIDIEYKLVIPFCMHIMQKQPTFYENYQWRQVLFQTITDESYHVQLTEHASEITKNHRNLHHVNLPTSNIMHVMQECLAEHNEKWEQELIILAACIVTEMVIGEHLGVVAKCQDERLQDLVTTTTKTHMMDESVHGSIFEQILREYYMNLAIHQKKFFNSILPKVMSWFIVGKLRSWKILLPTLEVPKHQTIIEDCESVKSYKMTYDISKLIALAEEFGLCDLEDKIMHSVLQA